MLSISPIVSPTGSSTDFRQLLIQQRREVLDAWVEEQLKQGRVESLPAAELREQCDQFLSLLAGPANSDSILDVNDLPTPESCRLGSYVTPAAYEIDGIERLKAEVFGPILHVVRFGRGHLDKVVAAINATGFGLTLGLHSRIEAVADYVAEHARVGNLYVNRAQIGAVPGAQPFGGEGLSGTGPKAGGPNYLLRFTTERVRSTDITATGGNVPLLVRETLGNG